MLHDRTGTAHGAAHTADVVKRLQPVPPQRPLVLRQPFARPAAVRPQFTHHIQSSARGVGGVSGPRIRRQPQAGATPARTHCRPPPIPALRHTQRSRHGPRTESLAPLAIPATRGFDPPPVTDTTASIPPPTTHDASPQITESWASCLSRMLLLLLPGAWGYFPRAAPRGPLPPPTPPPGRPMLQHGRFFTIFVFTLPLPSGSTNFLSSAHSESFRGDSPCVHSSSRTAGTHRAQRSAVSHRRGGRSGGGSGGGSIGGGAKVHRMARQGGRRRAAACVCGACAYCVRRQPPHRLPPR